ncbi:LOW QUALITY PROTEIN: agamous-like MADS-box protein AP3 [Corylus avellana]|uniref:LOW QUALITY PROTEIN: agamous-like MADS-box protein AP3 n=1 Tax=Corylus avellana TaxID=13451 RepID=UPI00286A98FC|nr:LOW QUALITY PROTEIN: agamous-like MADS-box protein AP3 [Corylus avellana]
MGRGKMEMKKIENKTSRQVTYSKRRNGLFKKAMELTVLCDAKVSIIMFSTSNKLQEYISPSITTKQLFDEYQKISGNDLWSSQYEKNLKKLTELNEVNKSLRREIRQRRGESLNDLNLTELHDLEQEMEVAVKVIRDRKYRVITNRIEAHKKKSRNAEEVQRFLLHELDARNEDPQYGLVDNAGDYGSLLGCSNGDSGIFALRLNDLTSNQQPNFRSGSGSELTTYTLLE